MDQANSKTSSIANGSGDIKINILEYDPAGVAPSYPEVASDPLVEYMEEILKTSSIANGSESGSGSGDIKIDILEYDPLVEYMEEILKTKSVSSSRCSIYKVPKGLRSMNPEAYTPQVISIGPYHHGKEDFKAMELHKLSFLQSFFRRTNLNPVIVIEKVRSWEKRARECYSEPINMNSDDFVKLILVDGCFLVEYFIRQSVYPISLDDYEIDNLIDGRLSMHLVRDLIMLENQLPFFVLQGLSQFYPETEDISISELIHRSITGIFTNQKENPNMVYGHIGSHLLNELWRYFIPEAPPSLKQAENIYICRRPPTATELYEAGVIFKRADNKRLGDVIKGIAFKNGVLEIPHIEIYDELETYLRNLIAFEQCHCEHFYVTQFALFMDGLINTDRDVSLLIKRRIIANQLGDDKDVSTLFNNLGKYVSIIGCESYYNDVCEELQKYCLPRRHRWMASLRREYFNTPWAFISFSAAVVLLLLTVIQTIFSGLTINK